MSKTIDSKVVEMSFDNKNFESNVQESLGTLDKLKKALNFDTATKGFEDINAASKKINFGAIGDGIDELKLKFSALDVFAVNAITRISNSLLDAAQSGVSFVKSLTVDQIKSGYQKYDQETASVQTLVNSTGKSVEEIEGYLDRLMWYSDETSYSFTEMTSSLAQMASSGGDIDKLIPMITGIANATAFAGKSGESFLHTIRNLSQSYSSGYLQLTDMKSLDLAGTSSKQLKEIFIETAEALGKLEKGTVTVENFNASLRDKWADKEVMEIALGRFSELSEAAYEAVNAGLYDTASEAIAAIGDNYDWIARRAFMAAQEAKSFQEAIDATKDAVSSGWMETFKIIFGNYDEAKSLWTDLANWMWEVFAASAESRNGILELWKEKGGRDEFIDAIWNILHAFEQIKNIVSGSLKVIFPSLFAETDEEIESAANKLLAFTKKLKDFTSGLVLSDETADKIQRTFGGILSVFKLIGKAITSVVKGFAPLTKVFTSFGGAILSVTASIGDFLSGILASAEEMGIFEAITERVSSVVQVFANLMLNLGMWTKTAFHEAGKGIQGFFEFLNSMVTFVIPANLVKSFYEMLSVITGKDFTESSEKAIASIRKFSNNVEVYIDKAIEYLKKIPNEIDKAFTKITGKTISQAFEDLKTDLVGLKDNLKDFFKNFDGFDFSGVKEKFGTFGDVLSEAFAKIKAFFSGFSDLDTSGFDGFKAKMAEDFAPLIKFFSGVAAVFGAVIAAIKKMVPVLGEIFGAIGEALGKFGTTLKEKIEALEINPDTIAGLLTGGGLVGIAAGINKFVKTLKESPADDIKKSIIEILNAVRDTFSTWQTKIKASALKEIAIAIALIAASLVAISLLDSSKLLVSLMTIATAAMILETFVSSLSKFTKGSLNMMGFSASIVMLSAALLIMAGAIAILCKYDIESLGVSLLAVYGMMYLMVQFANSLSLIQGNIAKVTPALLGMAAALLLFMIPVKMFAKMAQEDSAALAGGVLAVGTLIGTMVAALKLLGDVKTNEYAEMAAAMISMAYAMKILSKAVKAFVDMMDDPVALAGGILAIMTLMLSMTAVFKLLDGVEASMLSAAASMLIISAAMIVMAEAVKKFAEMAFNPGELLIGVGVLLGILAAMALTFLGLSSVSPAILAVGAAMLLASLALKVIMGTLVEVIPLFAQMAETDTLKNGLWSLIAAFAALAAAGVLAAVAAPGLIALGAAIALIGVGLLAAGTGALRLAEGLALLAVSGAAGIGTLVLAFKALIALIPDLGNALANGLMNFISTLMERKAELKLRMIEMFGTILEALNGVIPKLMEHLGILLDAFLKFAKEEFPKLIEAVCEIVIQFVLGVLNAVKAHVREFIVIGMEILAEFIVGLAEGVVKFNDILAKAAIELCYSLGDTLKENAEPLREAIIYLGKSIIEAFKMFFGISSPSKVFAELGEWLIKGLVNGIKNIVNTVVTTIRNMMTQMKVAITNKFAEWKYAGHDLIQNVINGITDKIFAIKQSVIDLVNNAKTALWNMVGDWYNIGADMMQGLINGITNIGANVKTTVTNVASGAINAFKRKTETRSPSRVFTRLGEYLDEGLIVGLQNYAGRVEEASGDVGEQAIDAMKQTVSKLSDSITDELDTDPVIKPVLDLSNIQNGAGLVNGLFGDQSMRLAYAADGFSMNNDLRDRATQESMIQKAMNEAFNKYVPEIINAITTSAAEQKFTFDFTPNTRRFYKEMRVENQKFERSNGYNGLI